MRDNRSCLLILALLAIATSLLAYPSNQPYASYWHPNTLLNWSPEADPDAPYNRCIVPLADRYIPYRVDNSNNYPNAGRVANLYISAGTSNNPSQGWPEAEGPAFHFWQYTDRFVFWGGSAGEGLILAPTTDVIAAAHRNGVPILGTIFFPPTAYGGQIQWVNDLLQMEGETYPVADKLIQVCEYYGFDGWFINQETAGGNAATAEAMRDFMIYFQQNSDLELMWYDAMTESGSVSWQEQLNENNDMFFQYGDQLVSETMFLDFGWNSNDVATSVTNAIALGRSQYELYAGIDVQANGYNTNANWSLLLPESAPHNLSVGLYCPSWCYESSTDLQDYYERASRFWVGANRDPLNTETTDDWKGIANYIPADRAVTQTPFSTNFCTGQGYGWFTDGVQTSDQAWYNRAMQDVLPTHRWRMNGDGELLYPEFDWTDAWQGGNCIKITGDFTSTNWIYLMETHIDLQPNTHLDITWKYPAGGDHGMVLEIKYEDSFSLNSDFDSAPDGEWHTSTFTLSGSDRGVLEWLALHWSNPMNDFEIKIGGMRIYTGEPTPPAAPMNVVIDSKAEDELNMASIRLRWDASTDDVQTYHVYRVKPDGNRQFLWGCCSEACFIPEIHRIPDELQTTLEVFAIGLDGERSEPATAVFDWNVGLPPQQVANPNPVDGEANAPSNCALLWAPSSNADSYNVYFGTTQQLDQVTSTTAPYYKPQGIQPGTQYFWRIDPVSNMGTTTGEVWSFTTGQSGLGLFTNHLDVGEVNTAGNVSFLDETYSVTASGADIWNSSDELHYVFKKFEGDTDFIIRCVSVDSQEDWTKAGIMMRNDWSDPGSAFALAMQITDNHVTFQYRTEDGESASWIGYTTGGTGGPKWLRLVRIGNFFRAYYSEEEDPDEWVIMGNGIDIQMNTEAFAGIALSAHDDNVVAEAVFDQASIFENIDVDSDDILPCMDRLLQNYPNPFNPETTFSFDLKKKAEVVLQVFNIRGQRIRTIASGNHDAGRYNYVWHGDDEQNKAVASGIYLYRLQIDGKAMPTRKCLLLK